GFVYSDPTFASSLGYGLQISEQDLQSAWDIATRPRQALAFVPRPRPPTRQAHLAEANPPQAIARVVVTPTPAPVLLRATEVPVLAADMPTPTSTPLAAQAVSVAASVPGHPGVAVEAQAPPADWSWTVLIGLAAISVATLSVRGWRARRQS